MQKLFTKMYILRDFFSPKRRQRSATQEATKHKVYTRARVLLFRIVLPRDTVVYTDNSTHILPVWSARRNEARKPAAAAVCLQHNGNQSLLLDVASVEEEKSTIFPSTLWVYYFGQRLLSQVVTRLEKRTVKICLFYSHRQYFSKEWKTRFSGFL